MAYPETLEELRIKADLTIGELADRIGVNHSTAWRWEKQGAPPSGAARTILNQIAREAGYEGFMPPSPVETGDTP